MNGVTDDARELLGAYALDAVDDVERRAVERLVAADPSAAAELAPLRATAAELGAAVAGEPPASLRASVLAALAGQAQEGRRPPAPVPAVPDPPATAPVPDDPALAPVVPLRRPRAVRWLSVAAALVVAAGVPGVLALQQAQRADRAELAQAQVEAAQQRTAQQIADLLTDPSAVLVRGAVTGGGVATAVFTEDRSLFSATGVPDPAEGSVYQLWLVDGGVITSAGVLTDEGGSLVQLVETGGVGSLAVSVEPAGGSEQPTTTPVVLLTQA